MLRSWREPDQQPQAHNNQKEHRAEYERSTAPPGTQSLRPVLIVHVDRWPCIFPRFEFWLLAKRRVET